MTDRRSDAAFPVIGIPRALLYHKYGYYWESFFRYLKVRTIVSPPTNKEILGRGLSLTIDENCLPMKIFLGHVEYLKKRSTHIFIPRIASLCKGEENCMKMWSLIDTVETVFPGIKIVSYNIDKINGGGSEFQEMIKMGLQFNKNPFSVARAVKRAKSDHSRDIEKRIKTQDAQVAASKRLKILIFAHAYVIHDEFIGSQITNFFKKEGVDVVFAHLTDSETAKEASRSMSEDLYWTYHKELVGSLELQKGKVDGIVYLMAFSCGPDALVIELCKRKIKDVPSILLSLDELQSDGGVLTRLESFLDIIRYKKQKHKTHSKHVNI